MYEPCVNGLLRMTAPSGGYEHVTGIDDDAHSAEKRDEDKPEGEQVVLEPMGLSGDLMALDREATVSTNTIDIEEDPGCKALRDLLTGIKLERYYRNFHNNGVADIDVVLKIEGWAMFESLREATGMNLGETIKLFHEVKRRRQLATDSRDGKQPPTASDDHVVPMPACNERLLFVREERLARQSRISTDSLLARDSHAGAIDGEEDDDARVEELGGGLAAPELKLTSEDSAQSEDI